MHNTHAELPGHDRDRCHVECSLHASYAEHPGLATLARLLILHPLSTGSVPSL